MINDFSYNGINLRAFGFEIKNEPVYTVAERDKELIESAGADGAELLDNEGFKNVPVDYEVNSDPYLCSEKSNRNLANNLIDWLFSSDNEYRVLRDTYHPGMFTLATPINPQSIECIGKGAVDTTLHFSRKPYWYTDEGQEVHTYELNDTDVTITIFNPMLYNSKPYIKVTTGSAFELTTNGEAVKKVTIAGVVSYVEIDSEEYNVHAGTTDFNDYTTGNYLPIFKPGENTLRIKSLGDSPITKVEIIPRWRRL